MVVSRPPRKPYPLFAGYDINPSRKGVICLGTPRAVRKKTASSKEAKGIWSFRLYPRLQQSLFGEQPSNPGFPKATTLNRCKGYVWQLPAKPHNRRGALPPTPIPKPPQPQNHPKTTPKPAPKPAPPPVPTGTWRRACPASLPAQSRGSRSRRMRRAARSIRRMSRMGQAGGKQLRVFFGTELGLAEFTLV